MTFSKLTYLKSLRGADLSHAQRRVLGELVNYSDAHGHNARPGNPRLAEDCRMSQREVERCLKRLRELNYVLQVSRGCTGRASVYSINPTPTSDSNPTLVSDCLPDKTGATTRQNETTTRHHGSKLPDTGVGPSDHSSDQVTSDQKTSDSGDLTYALEPDDFLTGNLTPNLDNKGSTSLPLGEKTHGRGEVSHGTIDGTCSDILNQTDQWLTNPRRNVDRAKQLRPVVEKMVADAGLNSNLTNIALNAIISHNAEPLHVQTALLHVPPTEEAFRGFIRDEIERDTITLLRRMIEDGSTDRQRLAQAGVYADASTAELIERLREAVARRTAENHAIVAGESTAVDQSPPF